MASKTISTIEAGLGHDSGALQAIYKEIEGYSYVIKALDKDVGRLRRLHHLNLTTKKYLWEYVQVKQLRRKAVETRRRLNLAIKDHHYLNRYLFYLAVVAYNKRLEGIVKGGVTLRSSAQISPEYREYSKIQTKVNKTKANLQDLQTEKEKIEQVREYLLNAVNERLQQITTEEARLTQRLDRLLENLNQDKYREYRKVDAAFPKWQYYFNRLVDRQSHLYRSTYGIGGPIILCL